MRPLYGNLCRGASGVLLSASEKADGRRKTLFQGTGNADGADDSADWDRRTGQLFLLLLLSAGLGFGLWLGLPLVGVLAVASVLGEIFLWGSFVWLLLKNLCGRKRLPFWQISLAAAFLGLYAIGGLMQ